MAHDSTDKFYNPLKRYQTYAYHHILIACDSTKTARDIEEAGNITELQRSRRELGTTSDEKYKAQITKTGGRFVVLVDGLTDSDFYVQAAEWSTMIAPTEQDQHSMLNINGKIEIFEPYGVSFLNRLVNLGTELGTDTSGIMFVLKTVFVGYRDDDPPPYNVTMLPHYRPFLFTLTNITSVINETGASYEMTVFGASNGFAKLPQVSNMGKGFAMQLNAENTIEQALRLAFEKINEAYLAQAEKLNIKLSDDKQTFAEGGNYRQVKYSVIAKDYAGQYFAGTNENTLAEVEPGVVGIGFGEGTTVEGIIDKIMKSSKEVSDDAGGDGKRYIYKISSMIESTPTSMEVVYQVNRYKMATTPYLAVQNKIPDDIPADQIREYDYIFTGQNTDILDLDIKMNLGMSFFHTVSSSSHPVTQDAHLGGNVSKQSAGASDGGTNTADGKLRPLTPLFLGDKVTDSNVRNTKDPISSANFQAMLARHAFLESTAVTMKIAGDPILMAEVLETVEETTEENAGQDKRRSYLATPIIFKINIRYPIDGTLKPFWYQGLYTLQKVDNVFADGAFTQTLTLYSLPTVSDMSVTLTEKNTSTAKSKVDSADPVVGGVPSDAAIDAAAGVSNKSAAELAEIIRENKTLADVQSDQVGYKPDVTN